MMNNTYELIVKSKNGDIEALYNLIQQYKILIKKFSYVNGIYDEDLNQYLKEKIICSIGKFEIKTKSSS